MFIPQSNTRAKELRNITDTSYPPIVVSDRTTILYAWLEGLTNIILENIILDPQWRNFYSLENTSPFTLGNVINEVCKLTRIRKLYRTIPNIDGIDGITPLIKTTTLPENTFVDAGVGDVFGVLDPNVIDISKYEYNSIIQREWLRFCLYPYYNDCLDIFELLRTFNRLIKTILPLVNLTAKVTKHINYNTDNIVVIEISILLIKVDGTTEPYSLNSFLLNQVNVILDAQSPLYSCKVV